MDLIATLPARSLWRSSQVPQDAWGDTEYLLARIVDAVDVLARGMRYSDHEHVPVERPLQHAQRLAAPRRTDEARERSREVRDAIEQTEWEEVT